MSDRGLSPGPWHGCSSNNVTIISNNSTLTSRRVKPTRMDFRETTYPTMNI